MMRSSRRWTALLPLAALVLGLAGLGQAQPASDRSSFRPGLRLEYFSRKIEWDTLEGEATSTLEAALATLVLAYEPGESFSLAFLAGYSSTNFDGLIFRRLPFSVDYKTGGISGLVAGAEARKSLRSGERLDLDLSGEFLAYFGMKKKSSLPDLAVPGTIEARPNWMRASVGAVLSFGRGTKFLPYFYPSFDYLWGTCELSETVEDLKGSEKKEIKGKSLVGLALGAIFELSSRLRLKAEVGVYPYRGGVDYSVTIKTLLAL